MVMREARTLSRDVEVAAIPYGDRLTLTMGTTVFITQALGGSYTAMTDHGYLVRIEGKDADAIGEKPVAPDDGRGHRRGAARRSWPGSSSRPASTPRSRSTSWTSASSTSARPSRVDGDGQKVKVEFTLTAPGCGMGDFLRQDVQQKLLAIPGVKEADVQVVLDPPWDQSMMSDVARLQLGLM